MLNFEGDLLSQQERYDDSFQSFLKGYSLISTQPEGSAGLRPFRIEIKDLERRLERFPESEVCLRAETFLDKMKAIKVSGEIIDVASEHPCVKLIIGVIVLRRKRHNLASQYLLEGLMGVCKKKYKRDKENEIKHWIKYLKNAIAELNDLLLQLELCDKICDWWKLKKLDKDYPIIVVEFQNLKWKIQEEQP